MKKRVKYINRFYESKARKRTKQGILLSQYSRLILSSLKERMRRTNEG